MKKSLSVKFYQQETASERIFLSPGRQTMLVYTARSQSIKVYWRSKYPATYNHLVDWQLFHPVTAMMFKPFWECGSGYMRRVRKAIFSMPAAK